VISKGDIYDNPMFQENLINAITRIVVDPADAVFIRNEVFFGKNIPLLNYDRYATWKEDGFFIFHIVYPDLM
jgi:hypothetical protein